ncbi:hypothetical protein [Luteolibacter sp. LG18]|uniref:hypothetical protein n=1 Tax=Luteolibacter sp. LG18 TaxID=2819286 RepID=UPI0030C7297D
MSDYPYTPPQADSQLTPFDLSSTQGWRVRDGRLWVEDGAVLPEIDPYTGGSGGPMTGVPLLLPRTPWWFWWLPFPLAAAGAATTMETEAKIGAMWGLIAGFVLCGVLALRFPRCRMRIFLSSSTALSRRVSLVISQVLLVITLLAMTRSDFREPQSWWLAATSGGALLILALHATFLQRRLVCRRVKDGWFEIRGVHPLALAQLVIGRSLSA